MTKVKSQSALDWPKSEENEEEREESAEKEEESAEKEDKDNSLKNGRRSKSTH